MKSMDMCFNWVKDRVKQQQFLVSFVHGLSNIADFFTKALPVSRHRAIAPLISLDPDESTLDTDNAKYNLSKLFGAPLHSISHHAGVLIYTTTYPPRYTCIPMQLCLLCTHI
jgi:hypothetical protein